MSRNNQERQKRRQQWAEAAFRKLIMTGSLKNKDANKMWNIIAESYPVIHQQSGNARVYRKVNALTLLESGRKDLMLIAEKRIDQLYQIEKDKQQFKRDPDKIPDPIDPATVYIEIYDQNKDGTIPVSHSKRLKQAYKEGMANGGKQRAIERVLEYREAVLKHAAQEYNWDENQLEQEREKTGWIALFLETILKMIAMLKSLGSKK